MTRTDVSGRMAALVLAASRAACAQLRPPQPAASPPAAATPTTAPPVLQPQALDLLRAMSARLVAARTMSFTAITTYESPSRLGPPLSDTTIAEVTLQRPDKLRVLTPGDGAASEFYDDGRTILAYAPAETLVAVADAPPTIDATLKAAYDRAAIYFPFADVIVGHTAHGGTASGGDGSWHGTGAEGGTASGGDGSWQAHGAYGGTASGGDGSWQARDDGTSVYGGYDHPTTTAYSGSTYSTYHPPTVVDNYYGSGCYDCGGWSTAGAAAAGVVAGAAIGSAATTAAYDQGVAAGSAYAMNAV